MVCVPDTHQPRLKVGPRASPLAIPNYPSSTAAWGALGHALGFALLAAGSSGTIPGVSGP